MDTDTGATASVALMVSEVDTALAMGSGDVAVLATPRVLALMEQAAVAALGDRLPVTETSVGAAVELEHLRPTRVGATVVATATLTGRDGRRLSFSMSVEEDGVEVARARHRRVVVDRTRFA